MKTFDTHSEDDDYQDIMTISNTLHTTIVWTKVRFEFQNVFECSKQINWNAAINTVTYFAINHTSYIHKTNSCKELKMNYFIGKPTRTICSADLCLLSDPPG